MHPAGEDQPTSGSANDVSSTEATASLHDELEQQLREVQEVYDKIESQTQFPPFDRNQGMLRMQADVLTWMADISSRTSTHAAAASRLRQEAAEVERRMSRQVGRDTAP